MTQGTIKTYRDLVVWQKAMEFVTDVYVASKTFPQDEMYGLTSQIRRCAISMPSNIAEGFGRKTPNEFIRFLQIAMGSLFEMQTQLEIALNLSYLTEAKHADLHEKTREIERMLSSLIRSIRTR